MKLERKISEGTHLMHLETSRGVLHEAVNDFLCRRGHKADELR